jgi:hypothetical protein
MARNGKHVLLQTLAVPAMPIKLSASEFQTAVGNFLATFGNNALLSKLPLVARLTGPAECQIAA